jgi:hypothetical protein
MEPNGAVDGDARLDVTRVLLAADTQEAQEDVGAVDGGAQLDVVQVLVAADSQEDVGVVDVASALLVADSQLDIVLDSKEDGNALDIVQDSVDIAQEHR